MSYEILQRLAQQWQPDYARERLIRSAVKPGLLAAFGTGGTQQGVAGGFPVQGDWRGVMERMRQMAMSEPVGRMRQMVADRMRGGVEGIAGGDIFGRRQAPEAWSLYDKLAPTLYDGIAGQGWADPRRQEWAGWPVGQAMGSGVDKLMNFLGSGYTHGNGGELPASMAPIATRVPDQSRWSGIDGLMKMLGFGS